MTLTDDDKFWLLREADWQREQAAHDAARLAEELRTMDPVQFLREYGIKNACPRHLSADGRSYLCLSESEHFALRGDPGNVGHRLEVTQNHREYDGALDPWEADHATE